MDKTCLRRILLAHYYPQKDGKPMTGAVVGKFGWSVS